jgi:hypothetical protein
MDNVYSPAIITKFVKRFIRDYNKAYRLKYGGNTFEDGVNYKLALFNWATYDGVAPYIIIGRNNSGFLSTVAPAGVIRLRTTTAAYPTELKNMVGTTVKMNAQGQELDVNDDIVGWDITDIIMEYMDAHNAPRKF